MNKLYITGLFLVHCLISQAQTVCTAESRARLESFLSKLAGSELTSNSYSEQASEIGQWFLGTPYVEKTLELPGSEKLVINLQGLDCTTFVETVVTLTRLSSRSDFTYESFESELENLRYRDGKNNGYPSRLHYFSDWIYENQEKGIIKDITEEIGGSPYPNAPSFMSENPKFYPQLSDFENLEAIKLTENQIQERNYSFIPKADIRKLEKNIKSGDIIAITTSMPNLDIVHTGFALEQNGRIHLLHASFKNMKVEISEKTLSEYLTGSKSQSGIMVARLIGK